MGDARSIAAIDYSIEKGWTGMFEPTTTTTQATNGQRTAEQRSAEYERILERYPAQ
jgi:hypothetical protein